MKIFLIGYMACGKSTIGRKLNQRLGWRLYDTDKEIVASRGETIAEIFDAYGEEYFRELERSMIQTLSQRDEQMIISTGGGAPIYGDNMQLMNAAGLTIYLSRSAENIAKRLSQFGRDKRPKLRGLNNEELLAFMSDGIDARRPFYNQAKLIIDAARYTDDEIVQIIVNHVKNQDL